MQKLIHEHSCANKKCKNTAFHGTLQNGEAMPDDDACNKAPDDPAPFLNDTRVFLFLLVVLSELAHCISAQELLRHDQQAHVARRVSSCCSMVFGGFGAFLLRVLLFGGLVSVFGIWGGLHSSVLPLPVLSLLHKPRKHRSPKFALKPKARVEQFKVEVDVLYHGVEAPLHINRIIGDGNCYWRAVAKQKCMSWYKLKKAVTDNMLQYAVERNDSELVSKIKQLQKKGAWANALAILGTARYLQQEIRVCTKMHVIRCSPLDAKSGTSAGRGSSLGVVNLHFDKSHYSIADAADVRHRLSVASANDSCSLKEFLCLPLEAFPRDRIVARHRISPDLFQHTRAQKIRCSKARAALEIMPPRYRPAGPGLPSRRSNESVAEQVRRVAKATAPPPTTTPTTPPPPPPRKRAATMTPSATVSNTSLPSPQSKIATMAKALPEQLNPATSAVVSPLDSRPFKKPRTPPTAPRRSPPSSAHSRFTLPPSTDEISGGGECTDCRNAIGSTRAPIEALVDEVSRRVLERLASSAYMMASRLCAHVMLTHCRRSPNSSLNPKEPYDERFCFTKWLYPRKNPRNDLRRPALQQTLTSTRCLLHKVARAFRFSFLKQSAKTRMSKNQSTHQKRIDKTANANCAKQKLTVSQKLCQTDSQPSPCFRTCRRALIIAMTWSNSIRLLTYSYDKVAFCGLVLVGFLCIGHLLSYWSESYLESLAAHRVAAIPAVEAMHRRNLLNDRKCSLAKMTASSHSDGRACHYVEHGKNEQPHSPHSRIHMDTDAAAVTATNAKTASRQLECSSSFMGFVWALVFLSGSCLVWETWNSCSCSIRLQGGMDYGFQSGSSSTDFAATRLHAQSHISHMCKVASLEACAECLLKQQKITPEHIQQLLDHSEVPWVKHGHGYQVILGAARLSLTKYSRMYPNFTRVIIAYMKQCNDASFGTTIALNKNVMTEMHTDSQNEKLPAFLTSITEYVDGEIFLKSSYGDATLQGCQGFRVPIPRGSTFEVPTFKIPHATCNWSGNRIIAVLFTASLNRLASCKNHLIESLKQLGFRVPERQQKWTDVEICGNANGVPVYSRSASIQGYFDADRTNGSNYISEGDRLQQVMVQDAIYCNSSDKSDATNTWPDLFNSDISVIEPCSDESPRSIATTCIDSSVDSVKKPIVRTDCSSDDNSLMPVIDSRKRKPTLSLRSSRDSDAEHRGSDVGIEMGVGLSMNCPRSSSDAFFKVDLNSHMGSPSSFLYGSFGLAPNSANDRSLNSDPIESFADSHISDESLTNDEMLDMRGGGAPADEFQANKADISKMVQKLKSIKHGFAPKQIRMLLVSDSKFLKKITRTTDSKQLQSCVEAAAQRMGLIAPTKTSPGDSAPASSSTRPGPSAIKVPTRKEQEPSEKNANIMLSRGKGKGDTSRAVPKGKGKSKNNGMHSDADSKPTPQSGKSKGKGKQATATYTLEPDGWNVLPLEEFSTIHGGVYVCEKEEQAKQIAEQGVGRPYPIGVVAPFPIDIGVKQPETIHVEFIKKVGEQIQKISMQAFLHQITHADVVYRKSAPVVNIQKPSSPTTSVCYLTFSDEGACVQTKLEMQQKRLPTVKQWISSLVQLNRGLDILDVWNIQEVQQTDKARVYQASVRVQSAHVESLLAMSGPGKLQVNVPGALRINMQHVWLKKEGRSMNDAEVLTILGENSGKHLGAFQIRGTWAIRMLNKHHNEFKTKLGRNEDPAYFIKNVPPEMEQENMQELLQQLKWNATVKSGERRWKGAGYTWLVRSCEDPRVWQFPITFGYERRTLKVEAARKAKTIQQVPAPAISTLHFPSWNAQGRNGKLHSRNHSMQTSYADVVLNGERKRQRHEDHVMQRDDSETWSQCEEAPVETETDTLKQQLAEMVKQNHDQQQTIQQLMQQIQNLTAQFQSLNAQNLSGGSQLAAGNPLGADPSIS